MARPARYTDYQSERGAVSVRFANRTKETNQHLQSSLILIVCKCFVGNFFFTVTIRTGFTEKCAELGIGQALFVQDRLYLIPIKWPADVISSDMFQVNLGHLSHLKWGKWGMISWFRPLVLQLSDHPFLSGCSTHSLLPKLQYSMYCMYWQVWYSCISIATWQEFDSQETCLAIQFLEDLMRHASQARKISMQQEFSTTILHLKHTR